MPLRRQVKDGEATVSQTDTVRRIDPCSATIRATVDERRGHVLRNSSQPFVRRVIGGVYEASDSAHGSEFR